MKVFLSKNPNWARTASQDLIEHTLAVCRSLIETTAWAGKAEKKSLAVMALLQILRESTAPESLLSASTMLRTQTSKGQLNHADPPITVEKLSMLILRRGLEINAPNLTGFAIEIMPKLLGPRIHIEGSHRFLFLLHVLQKPNPINVLQPYINNFSFNDLLHAQKVLKCTMEPYQFQTVVKGVEELRNRLSQTIARIRLDPDTVNDLTTNAFDLLSKRHLMGSPSKKIVAAMLDHFRQLASQWGGTRPNGIKIRTTRANPSLL